MSIGRKLKKRIKNAAVGAKLRKLETLEHRKYDEPLDVVSDVEYVDLIEQQGCSRIEWKKLQISDDLLVLHGPDTKRKLKAFSDEIQRDFREIAGDDSVRVDPTYDLSRIAKVPGTLSCKGEDKRLWRLSRGDPRLFRGGVGLPDERLTFHVMNLAVVREGTDAKRRLCGASDMDDSIMRKVEGDPDLSRLWTTNPQRCDGGEDRSVGDFVFVLSCLDLGIEDDAVLHELLVRRPAGKARARLYDNYIQRTIERAKAVRA